MWVFKNENDSCPICKAQILESLENDNEIKTRATSKINLVESLAARGQLAKQFNQGREHDGGSTSSLQTLAFCRESPTGYCLPSQLTTSHIQPGSLHRAEAFRQILANYEQLSTEQARAARAVELLRDQHACDMIAD